jgi:hypothetical protein
LRENLELLYRDSQEFAVTRIEALANDSFKQMRGMNTEILRIESGVDKA